MVRSRAPSTDDEDRARRKRRMMGIIVVGKMCHKRIFGIVVKNSIQTQGLDTGILFAGVYGMRILFGQNFEKRADDGCE
jgi:hypothetical protein